MLSNQIKAALSLALCAHVSMPHALDLSGAVALAHDNDAQYRVARAEYRATLEKYPQSLAGLLPDIQLSLYRSETDSETSNASGGFSDGQSSYSADGYGLSLSQTLYDKQLFDALERSGAEVSRALASFQAARQQMMTRTAKAYFDVLAANDNLVFAQAEKRAIAHQLEQSSERFDAGLIAITDVKESQAQFDIAVAQEIAARNQLADSREALNLLLASPFDALSSLRAEIPLLPPKEDIEHWQNNASANNLELRSAYYALNAASRSVSAARAGHYPTLELNLRHEADSSDGSSLGSSFGGRDSEDTRLSLELNIPIYSGGLTSSLHREKLAELDRAKAVLDRQKRLTLQQTRNAYRGITAAIAQVNALKKALESTQSATEATRSGFEVGTRTSVDVLLARREQHKSERNYTRALYDYILNVLELKRSAGTLTDEDIHQINRWLGD